MARSKWKGLHTESNALRLLFAKKESKEKKVWSRNTTVLDCFVDYEFKVYNGKTLKPVRIIKEMVGLKLGDFSGTRQKDRKKKKKINK